MNSVLIVILLATAFPKIYYALSRPLFFSGPDANGYIPAMEDFGSRAFLSPDISFMPFYPPGYPYLGSIFFRVSESYWIQLFQTFQILFFLVSIFFYFLVVKKRIGEKTAFVTAVCLSLSPALAVLNGQAMYESLFISLLFITLFILVVPELQLNKSRLFLGGLFLGGTVVVHPRALLIVCIILVYLFVRKKLSIVALLSGTTGFMIPFLIFSIRNLLAEKTFALSNALWAALTLNPFMGGCQSVPCALNRAIQAPLGFVEQVTLNVLQFWSPYSGPLKRGTWFHNISFFTYLDSQGLRTLALLISVLLMLFLFLTWLHGTVLLNRKSKDFNLILFGIFIASVINDALIYGDSRHRLAVMAFALPAQVTSIIFIYDSFRAKLPQSFLPFNHKRQVK